MSTDFDRYTSILKDVFWQRITAGIVIGVVILIVMLLLCIIRGEKLMWGIILICAEVILVFTTFFSVLPYGTDIHNRDYIIYEGEYTVQDIVAEKGSGFFPSFLWEITRQLNCVLKYVRKTLLLVATMEDWFIQKIQNSYSIGID